MRHKLRLAFLAAVLFALAAATVREVAESQKASWEFTSSPYFLADVTPSMEGPFEIRKGIYFGGSEQELLWLTGYQTIVLEAQSEDRLGQEFICHSSIFLDGGARDYRRALGTRLYGSSHLFTIAQGATRIEFPAGYAVPLPSGQPLQFSGQALNTFPENKGKRIRHRVRAEFVRDSALWVRPKPLFQVQAAGGVLVDEQQNLGQTSRIARGAVLRSDNGKVWSGHWVVPARTKNTNVTKVSPAIKLPFDTTVHYLTSHLHPYARWQELRDLTTGSVVYRVEPRSSPDGRALLEIPCYASSTGVPLFADHEYELVTHYNNTSDTPVTAMSILFMYLLDREFDPGAIRPYEKGPKVSDPQPAPRLEEFCGGS